MKINLKINGETHKYSSRALSWLNYEIALCWKSVERNSAGSCVVNYGKGYTNEFDFINYDDFYAKYNPCVEPALLKDLKG